MSSMNFVVVVVVVVIFLLSFRFVSSLLLLSFHESINELHIVVLPNPESPATIMLNWMRRGFRFGDDEACFCRLAVVVDDDVGKGGSRKLLRLLRFRLFLFRSSGSFFSFSFS